MLSQKIIKILRAVGDKAAEKVATTLSIMLNRKVNVKISGLISLQPEALLDLFTTEKREIVVAISRISEGLRGFALLICPVSEASRLTEYLVHEISADHEEIYESAFEEFSNIVLGNFISEMANMLGITIFYIKPQVLIDEVNAIIDGIIAFLSELQEEVYVYYLNFEDLLVNNIKLIIIPEVT